MKEFDYVILGAGIYGLYSACILAAKGQTIAVLEYEPASFQRASFVNQARIHNGYHYPRSFTTAKQTASYFREFCEEFDFALMNQFENIYAIADHYSQTNAEQFVKFCANAGIPCTEVDHLTYFQPNMIEAAFSIQEYSFDAPKIRNHLLQKLQSYSKAEIHYSMHVVRAEVEQGNYKLDLNDGSVILASNVINTTYASLNQIQELFGLPKLPLKYELCEVTLCKVTSPENVGMTVMDGPFFSLVPFGTSGLHVLSAVPYTPHLTSTSDVPIFECQKNNPKCNAQQLQNCSTCEARPESAFHLMRQLASKYLNESIKIEFEEALFAVKTIPFASEIDDARPTLIQKVNSNPNFISVLSGKISTIYDLKREFQ
ncbi:MAG TPA: FAD-dependent oxidoreductase [Acidobacteriota bacterium]|nr:FAD-dependent oxidoreductase [Acidobacteriota bacterium]